MTQPLFDRSLGALRRQRALRKGPALFLAERVWEDLVGRPELSGRRFRKALVIGLPDPGWAKGLPAEKLVLLPSLEDLATVEPGSHDLCVVVGQLDTADDLPLHLRIIRAAANDAALVIGAFPGNDNLPTLRGAMLAADRASGGVSPRVHPRVEASAFATLLDEAGFVRPVVDIDRVRIRYRAFDDLVADLRAMGSTNILRNRSSRPLSRAALHAARTAFRDLGDDRGTLETIEIIHFACWTSAARKEW